MRTHGAYLLGAALCLGGFGGLGGCGGGGGGAGGGGSGGGSGGGGSGPITGLHYAAPVATYESSVAAAPNAPIYGGSPATLWTVEPDLPTGLALDAATGVVSGTPSALSATTPHWVTATNPFGQATTSIDVAVVASLADSLAPKALYSDDDVRHLLSRTHFGGTAAEEATVKAVGLAAYVDAMVNPPTEPALEAEAEKQLWNKNDAPGLEGAFPQHDQPARWWLHLMIGTGHPFRDELALFWHDHFASSTAPVDSSQTGWMVTQIKLLRGGGAENLRDLLVAMSRDWMMLQWLDGVLNTKEAPNENYAREFWELFTLGADNGYTQADIEESARAFTGYRKRYEVGSALQIAEFDPLRHDPTAKTIFGHVIPGQSVTDDVAAVVDLTLAHRPAAEFISRRLIEHFVERTPSDALVSAFANLLRDANWALAPALKALFRSEAFYAVKARTPLVRSPVQELIAFTRATGLVGMDAIQDWEAPDGSPNTLRTLDVSLYQAAQRVTQPPSVNGWPQDRAWLSAQNLLDRANAILGSTSDSGDQAAAGIDVLSLLPAGADGPTAVDQLTARLRVVATPAQRVFYVTYMDTDLDASKVEVSSPFLAATNTQKRERIRGLLWILAQHPHYATR